VWQLKTQDKMHVESKKKQEEEDKMHVFQRLLGVVLTMLHGKRV
jgi:hypothetical protein